MSTTKAKKTVAPILNQEAPPPAKSHLGVPIYCRHDQLLAASDLQNHEQNYRKHPIDQVKRLAELIKANGWRRPIVVSSLSGRIIAGHGAAAAGILMGDTVPVEIQHFSSAAEEKRHMIGDNKGAEGGETDEAALVALMKEIEDLTPAQIGFDEKEFAQMFKTAKDLQNPPTPKANLKPSSVVYELVFDDKDQQSQFHAWLRKLKLELPNIPTIAGRIIHFITAPHE